MFFFGLVYVIDGRPGISHFGLLPDGIDDSGSVV